MVFMMKIRLTHTFVAGLDYPVDGPVPITAGASLLIDNASLRYTPAPALSLSSITGFASGIFLRISSLNLSK